MTKNTQENWIWRALLILASAGMLFMAFVSLSGGTFFFNEDHNVLNYFVTFGISLLISGACFCFGGLAGFLFGIPRIINSASAEKPRSTVMQNDNLVQISDWLTKILVGVGLTQLYEIPGLLKKIGDFLAPCFSYSETGSAIAISLVLYFLILGFMASYLWTRFYFSEMLEDTLDDPEDGPQSDAVNKMVNTTVQNMTINPAAANVPQADPAVPAQTPDAVADPVPGDLSANPDPSLDSGANDVSISNTSAADIPADSDSSVDSESSPPTSWTSPNAG